MNGPAPLFDRALGLPARRDADGGAEHPDRDHREELAERLTFVNRRFELPACFAAGTTRHRPRLEEGGQVKQVEMRLPVAGDDLGLPLTAMMRCSACWTCRASTTCRRADPDAAGAEADGFLLACLFAGKRSPNCASPGLRQRLPFQAVPRRAWRR